MARILLLLCVVGAAFGTESPTDEPTLPPAQEEGTEPPPATTEPPQCAASRFLPELAGKDFGTVLQCPPLNCSYAQPRDCHVNIGSMGGGVSTRGLCDGTIAAAMEALAQGATGLYTPVCLSRDNVPFVWYDCNMNNAEAIARRLGKFTFGKCAPYAHPSVAGKSAHELDFADIQRFWGYRSDWTQCSRLPGAPIPSLNEYLGAFKKYPISFVLAHSRSGLGPLDVSRLMWLASKMVVCHGLQHQILVSLALPQLVPAVQCAMTDAGALPGVAVQFSIQVSDIGDEELVTATMKQLEMSTLRAACAAGAPQLPPQAVQAVGAAYGEIFQIALQATSNPIALGKLMKKFQPVSLVKNLCLYGVFITRPAVPNGAEILKLTVLRALERRSRNHPKLHIFLSVIDSHKEMAWLLRHGVDGFLTGNVAVARAVLDTMTEGCGAHRPEHCTPPPPPSSSPAPRPQPAMALAPPPYITECLNADEQFTELNTFNKILHCWAKLLKMWSVARQTGATTTTAGGT